MTAFRRLGVAKETTHTKLVDCPLCGVRLSSVERSYNLAIQRAIYTFGHWPGMGASCVGVIAEPEEADWRPRYVRKPHSAP